MTQIYTIGYHSRSLESFIRLLEGANVDAVIDIRLRNTSHLAGFTKRDDLAFLLREGFHIQYEHRPDHAPTDEIMDGYKAAHDWEAYEPAFLALLAERRAEEIGRDLLSRYQRPCLLCAEAPAERCHRRLVAEWWARHLPDVEVVHLE